MYEKLKVGTVIEFKEDGKYIDKMTTYEEFLRLYK